tara:strand:+ start:571 stop:864 length:294 start_codon:yes stop_codon:yes gene_type:complete
MPRGSGVDSQQLRSCLPSLLVSLTGLLEEKASLKQFWEGLDTALKKTPSAILDARHSKCVLIVAFSSGHTIQTWKEVSIGLSTARAAEVSQSCFGLD